MDRGGTALQWGRAQPTGGSLRSLQQTAPSQPTGEVLTPRSHWGMHGAAQGVPGARPQPPLHVKASRISHTPLFSEPDPGTHNLPGQSPAP